MQKIETTPSLSERRHPLPGIVVVVLILAVYIVIAGRTAAVLSPTMDEALHIFSGCTYWKLNDFRFQPENGLASQRWIGLGALLSGEAARLSPKEEIFRPPGEPLDQFTFLKWSGDKVLTGGRLAIVLAGAILLFLVFLWSRFL